MKNELLKEALMRAHKTVEDVAQAVGVDPKTVQRWLHGRVPHARHRWAIAQLLEMREEDLWDLPDLPKQPALEILIPYGNRPHQSFSHSVAHEQDRLAMASPSLVINLDMLMKSRRQVLKEILSAASAAFVLSPSALFLPEARERLAFVMDHPSAVDTETIASLSAITEHYWKLSLNASFDLLSGIAGHFTTITHLLRESHPTSIYEQLCALASENAMLMGKMFSSIREYDLAWEYYKFSLRVARDIQKTDLWAAGTGWLSLLQINWGEPQQALPLLHEARSQSLQNPRLRPWLFAIEAEIQAKLGNAKACQCCLDTFKNAPVPLTLDDDIYHTEFDRSKALGYEGACFVHLRQPEQALPVLDKASTLCAPISLKSQRNLLTDKGIVYAQLGDTQTSCSLMLQALDLTEQTKSLIGLQRVYKGRRELDPWKESNEVKNLDERLADLLVRLNKQKEQVH